MSGTNHELLKKLLATFRIEAAEHVSAISSGLVELEKSPLAERRAEIVEAIFRQAHSLKGAARAVNLVKAEALCQSLETEFSRLKVQNQPFSSERFDQLHQMVDSLHAILSQAEASVISDSELAEPQRSQADGGPLIAESDRPAPPPTDATIAEGALGERRVVTVDKPSVPDTVRVSSSKLDALLGEAEELLSAKAAAAHRLTQLQDINLMATSQDRAWRKVRPVALDLRRFLDRENGLTGSGMSKELEKASLQTGRILSFLEKDAETLRSIRSQLNSLADNLEDDQRALDRRVNDLVTDAKRLAMLPLSSVLAAFPKLVRDLSRDYGKNVGLTIEGGDIEADRRILEEMKDPLMHLIRNCIDHGIEDPAERARKRKPPCATITTTISPKSGDRVEIVISDDGAGVDVQRVVAAATKLGLVADVDTQKMDHQEALSLVFRSGLSTSPIITEVSGRGLGLAIVQEKVEKVGGTVSIETRPGEGTTFRLVLPITLATFRGVLVRVGQNQFVLPAAYVRRILRVRRDEVKTAGNRETIQLNGRAASLVRLGDILGIAERTTTAASQQKMPAAVLSLGGEQMVFLVDEVLYDEEVMVKGLGKQLRRVHNIAGAAVLGTGKVVAVLNVADLFRSAAKATVGPSSHSEEKPKSVLVAEDSITARTLLKNILESVGYRVKTAADGAEALAALRTEDFDLLVSDVDMPRMSGLDLTAKVRADRRLSELPVVLVTALESRQDRERGVEVGANAYIVKSSFDQSNLLEIVRRLI